MWCLSANASTLTVLVGQHKPPYIHLDNIRQQKNAQTVAAAETIADSVVGFEIELLRETVKRMGYEAEFVYLPNARIRHQLEAGVGDIATLQPVVAQPEEPGLYFSEPYIRYQNVVVSRQADTFLITKPSDLVKLTTVAFQGASVVLGSAFNDMVQLATDYRETIDQKSQVDALLSGRADAIVLDRNIFTHHHHEAIAPVEVVMHELFGSTLYRAAFRDVQLQRAFNRALLSVELDHWYQQLQLKYFKQLNQSLPSALLCDGPVTSPITVRQ